MLFQTYQMYSIHQNHQILKKPIAIQSVFRDYRSFEGVFKSQKLFFQLRINNDSYRSAVHERHIHHCPEFS